MCGILSLEWSHTQPKRRKPMDKSCQVYGNFHVGNHNMIAGRRAYIAVHYSFCFAAPYQASRDKNTPVNNAIKVA